MTRKHYETIAAIIDSARAEHGHEAGILDIAGELASYFKRDNPRFDQERFLEACGLEMLS